jgi:hypothetical protein
LINFRPAWDQFRVTHELISGILRPSQRPDMRTRTVLPALDIDPGFGGLGRKPERYLVSLRPG